jgi:c-di-GMP-related signal transduction protein
MDVYIINHGFVVARDVYYELVKVLDEELEEMVAELKTESEILAAFRKRNKDTGSFVKTANMLKLHLVPMHMRHLVNMASYHEYGKKEFNLNFCAAVKG